MLNVVIRPVPPLVAAAATRYRSPRCPRGFRNSVNRRGFSSSARSAARLGFAAASLPLMAAPRFDARPCRERLAARRRRAARATQRHDRWRHPPPRDAGGPQHGLDQPYVLPIMTTLTLGHLWIKRSTTDAGPRLIEESVHEALAL